MEPIALTDEQRSRMLPFFTAWRQAQLDADRAKFLLVSVQQVLYAGMGISGDQYGPIRWDDETNAMTIEPLVPPVPAPPEEPPAPPKKRR